MHEFAEVQQHINKIARKELAPIEVVRIHMREGLTSFDEEPAYHIDIIYDGDRPGGKIGYLNLAIQEHLWKVKDLHFPVVRYIRVENEGKYHAHR